MNELKQIFWAIIGLIAFLTIIVAVAINGLDKSIDNQNKMLCYSAEKSGNLEYRSACKEYYKTGEIRYMRER